MTYLDCESQEQKYEFIAGQHGGYWRHDFVDHAYLYNLYFPPDALLAHFGNHLRELVLNYPVAQDVLAGLVGTLIGQPSQRIVVGNGASELIKVISCNLSGRLIVPVPSFNEYVNAAPTDRAIEFPLDPSTFELKVDQFAAQAARCKAEVAVVVTPNNPTSLVVPRTDLLRLAKSLAGHGCTLIVDESFIDFAPQNEQLTLERDIEHHPNLAVIKSMSKAYGICGLRIGYLLTANSELAETIRGRIPIWNINGFAEAFLRQLPNYCLEFSESCRQVAADRDALYRQLCEVSGMTVYRPAANFIFCRLPNGAASSPEVTRRLFVEHNMYVKHCQGKTLPDGDRYLRIASRTQPENTKLVEALKDIIGPKDH